MMFVTSAVVLLIAVIVAAVFLNNPKPKWDMQDNILPQVRAFAAAYDLGDDWSDLTIVVTGSTSGIGLSITKLLTSPEIGAHVVAMGRSTSKLRALRGEIGEDRITTVVADLADLDAVHLAAEEIAGKFEKIDILVNNAGLHQGFNFLQKQSTKQGYDLVFGVNYLSHVLLTEKLLPLLRASPVAKVVQVSSSFHWAVDGSDLKIDSHNDGAGPIASLPGGHHGWIGFQTQRQYANSKFAQVLHARSLQRRQLGVSAVSICPAWVATQIVASNDSWGHWAFQKIAYDSDGYGIASLFNAIASTDTKEDALEGDYFVNTQVINVFRGIFENLPSWASTALPIRDALGGLMSMILLVLQRRTATASTEPVSLPVKYTDGEKLEDDLDSWSRKVALKSWLNQS